MSQEIVDRFHQLYYSKLAMAPNGGTWFGIPIQKCPMDMMIFQEIINEVRPDWIIETGTMQGGSAMFMAMICQLRQQGRVISIDRTQRYVPEHPLIKYLLADSKSEEVFKYLSSIIGPKDTVICILDSDHSKDHVLAELRNFSKLVTLNSYLIVEDTNLHGHPVRDDHGEGPLEAVEEFLKETNDFIVDTSREKYLLTYNPGGYLRRIAVTPAKIESKELKGEPVPC